jgi:hypothetical protein
LRQHNTAVKANDVQFWIMRQKWRKKTTVGCRSFEWSEIYFCELAVRLVWSNLGLEGLSAKSCWGGSKTQSTSKRRRLWRGKPKQNYSRDKNVCLPKLA